MVGPALFSMGIDSLIRRVEAELNVWYLDDGTIGDSPEKVIICVGRLIDDLREVGLEINQRKCELTIVKHTREDARKTEELFWELLPGLIIVPFPETSLLGAPLSEEGISAVFIIESHQAFVFLKNCFALQKLQYILRSSPAYSSVEELEGFDRALVAALSAVTNVKFEGESLKEAVLPVQMGVLRIRLSRDIAQPAFISSRYSVRSLVDSVLQNVRLGVDGGLRLTLSENEDKSRQRAWDVPQSESSAEGLLEEADQISRASRELPSLGRGEEWVGRKIPSREVGWLW